MNDLQLTNQNGQAVVSSRKIAEDFGKEHKNVLRDIETLLRDVLEIEPMFYETTAPDSYGREQKVYLMNRDGFTLLAMGFTGTEAMQWKIRYIQAFNEMEKQLVTQLPNSYADALRELATTVEQKEALQIENAQSKQIINELKPKATYYDMILQNKSLLPITKIAKDYGMSGYALNSLLHELGIQYKMGDTWLLYQKFADQGYTQSKTHVIDEEKNTFHTYWTQAGRIFIYTILKSEKNILPLIEREAP